MITEYLHRLSKKDSLDPGRPRLVLKSLEEDVARFCLNRQYERAPAAFPDVMEFIGAVDVIVDRFWVRCFVHCQVERLRIQKATILAEDRHKVS
jgi:hypothetical protein